MFTDGEGALVEEGLKAQTRDDDRHALPRPRHRLLEHIQSTSVPPFDELCFQFCLSYNGNM